MSTLVNILIGLAIMAVVIVIVVFQPMIVVVLLGIIVVIVLLIFAETLGMAAKETIKFIKDKEWKLK